MMRTVLSVVSVVLAGILFSVPAAAAVQAGVSAAVRGDVDLLPVVEKVKRRVASGEDVFLGDEISSFDESGMQLMLLDETVFTIGPNTDLTVDEFVYDPATGAGQVTASLARGVLRFVTGKAAEASPLNTMIKLPVGTIGIRGTFGATLYDGVRALVVLLGPGLNNNADARVGRLTVTAAGVTVELTRTGFGTIIEPAQPPLPPFRLSVPQLASILGPLGPKSVRSPEKSPSVPSASTDAGADTAEARLIAVVTQIIQETVEKFFEEVDASEKGGTIVDADFSALFEALFQQLLDNPALTTLVELDPLTGLGSYEQLNVPLSSGGTYDFFLEIDFDAQTVGGGSSVVEIKDPGGLGDNVDFALVLQSFTDTVDPGNAVFEFVGDISGISFTVRIALSTESPIAGTANQIVSITNGVDVSTSLEIGQAPLVEVIPILDGISTFDQLDQLATIPNGQFQYNATGLFTQTFIDSEVDVNIAGVLESRIQINFGERTIGGGDSFIDVDTTAGFDSEFELFGDIDVKFSITAIDYSSGPGLAENVFSPANFTNFDSEDFDSEDFAGTNVTLNNSDGIIANTATTSVILDNQVLGNAGSGSVTSGPRVISE